MQTDPRAKNITFDKSSARAYFDDYLKNLTKTLQSADFSQLDAFVDAIVSIAKNGGRIFSAGNGGSATIADHLCCDFTKGTYAPGHFQITSQHLISSQALFTAIANDYGYEKTFAFQLETSAKKGDGVVLISSSGNSPNVVEAAKVAKRLGVTTFALVGFEGGQLKHACDHVLHVPIHNYGIVEDSHQMLMHAISQYIACRFT